MNGKSLVVFGLGVMLLASSTVFAGTIAATAANQPIVPGEWHQSLAKALAMSEDTGIPVIGLWANTGCSRCDQVIDQAVNTPAFTAWRTERQMLMVTGSGAVGLAGEVYDWTKQAADNDGNLSYPFIRVYWKQKDGTVRADYRFSGYPYRADAQALIDQIERFVGDFRYQGHVTFGFKAAPEMEPGTAAVSLPLVRNYGSHGVMTNRVTWSRSLEGGGTTNWTEAVVWPDGETARDLVVTNAGHYLGGTITVALRGEGEPDQTATITMVGTAPVSVKNPRFVGEPFGFAEWTMDLDAATNAVAADADGNARTLVLFTGMWCPYCEGYENQVVQSEAFKAFAASNHLALVMVEIPSRDGMNAGTLLTHNVFTNLANSADRRAGLNGTSYMTRHGISSARGWRAVESIWAYERLMTLPGKTFVNLPAMIMLRKDATVAGRIPGYYCFDYTRAPGTVYPPYMMFPLESNMARLNELLEMSRGAPAFAGEERNNYTVWDPETLGVQRDVAASLSSNDEIDTYVLDAICGAVQRVTVTGPDNAAVAVSILSNGVCVASSKGALSDGVSAETAVTPGAAYHVCVVTNDAVFINTNRSSTVRGYTVQTSIRLIAEESARVIPVAAYTNASGTLTTSLPVVEGETYRLETTGALFEAAPGAFVPVAGDVGFYRALLTGDVRLTLSALADDGAFTWQLWHPGTVGFVQAAASMAETGGSYSVVVQRVGGVSGACTVALALDADLTSATPGEDFADLFSIGCTVVWADGESGAKTVSLPLLDDAGYEGNEDIALNLSVVAGRASLADSGRHLVLTIVENDAQVIGRLAFTGTSSCFARTSPLTVVASEGGHVLLDAERVDGASTAISGTVTATAGSVAPKTLLWANNDRVPRKPVDVSLPMLAELPDGYLTVTLTPQTGVRTVTGKNAVRIRLIAADAPAFDRGAAAFTAQTMVAMERTVSVLRTTGGEVRTKRLSGELPVGIGGAYDAARGVLRFSGVPARAGVYTSVYQVAELRAGTWVDGAVVQVTLTVVPLAAVNGAITNLSGTAEGAVFTTNALARLVGTLSFSATKYGRVTAKYLSRNGTITFSGRSWTACDEDGTLTVEMAKGDYLLTVRMTAAGTLLAWVTDPAYADPLEVSLIRPPWSSLTRATAYEGYYTVVLSPKHGTGGVCPKGYSYLTLSLSSSGTRSGRVTYAGRLSDGTSWSGSARLLPLGADEALLLAFRRVGQNLVAAALKVEADAKTTYSVYPSSVTAYDGTEPFWNRAGGYAETSFDLSWEVFGGYYNPADSLVAHYEQYFGAGPLRLFASEYVPESPAYGTATALPSLDLVLSDTSINMPNGNANPTRARISLAKKSGIFRGTFRLPFATLTGETATVQATYSGVLLLGWTGEGCDCSDAELDLPRKPFGLGSYWFSDRVPVEAGGTVRMKPFHAGYPILLDKVE